MAYSRFKTRIAQAALLLAGSTLAAAQAAAQQPVQQPNSPAEAATESDIIVTAQRREESLFKTPVAVAAVTSEELARAQIKTEQDLRFVTPGLQIRSGLTATQLNFSLRGQSQDPFSDSRPGVLPYFNDVPIGGQGIMTALYDLSSVQVLKGPQGTLFGRSATGGAVLYSTAKPSFDFGGYASASYGNYNALKLEGAVNIPIIADAVALRVASFYSEKNGFQTNIFDGTRVGDRKTEGGRASLLIEPSAGIRNTLVWDHYHTDGQNTASILGGILPYTGSGVPLTPLQFLYAGNATSQNRATGIGTVQAFTGASNQQTTAFYDQYFADPRRSPGLLGVAASAQARGARLVNYNSPNIFIATVNTVVNTTEIDLGEHATLKNIFGFQRSVAKLSTDVDASPFSIQAYDFGPQVTNSRQYSDEIQVSGTVFDDRVNYVVGAFFSDEKLRYTGKFAFFDILFGGRSDSYDHTLSSKTYAAYGQATVKLNDTGLSVTGGLRYTSEEVGVSIAPAPADIGRGSFCSTAGFDCNQSETYKNLSWTFGIQDQVTDNLLVYAVTRRAYKAGGYNAFIAPRIGTAEAGGNAYKAERATDVEAGLKYNGMLGNVPFRTNIAAYYAWTRNGQRATYVILRGARGAVNVNVPKQSTYGLEFEAQVRPAEWLSVGGTFNYTNAKYTDGNAAYLTDDTSGNQVIVTRNFDRVPDTPETSGSIFADVTIPVTSAINMTVHGDLYFQSETFTSPRSANYAGTRIAPYELANFRVGVEDEEAGWSLTANLKNAFDKPYFVGGLANGEAVQYNTLVPGEPRTFTVEARIKF
jgi:iron complex outermembrane receptor protein